MKKKPFFFFHNGEFCAQAALREHFYKDTRQHIKYITHLSKNYYDENSRSKHSISSSDHLFENIPNNITAILLKQKILKIFLSVLLLALIWQAEIYFNILEEFFGHQLRLVPVKFSDIVVLL